MINANAPRPAACWARPSAPSQALNWRRAAAAPKAAPWGVLGAAIGAGVGNSSAACDSNYRRDTRYSNSGYSGTYVPPAYGYDNRRYDDRRDGYDYYRDYPQAIDPGFSPQTSGYQGYGDECRLAESNIRLPDGRMETRYVRSCRDQSGRYRVVD